MRIGTRLRALDTPLARSLLLGLAVSVAITMLSRLGGLAGWETRAIDTFLFFRDRVPTPEIVLVHIDEAAFQELGERQPLSRRYLAELAEFLLANGARVVGFDVQVKRASSPEEDGALVAVSRRWQGDGGRLVFTTVATPAGEGPSIGYATMPAFSPELRALVGFANAPLGGDGLVRTLLPVLPAAGGGQLPSFALAVLAGYASYSGESLARSLADAGGAGPVLPVGDPRKGVTGQEPVALKTLREANWRIDYVGRPGAFAAFPSGALVQLARSGVRPDADNPFRGKIVLVGDAPALKPGVRYRFQVEALGHPPYEAWFEIVEPGRAAAVRQELGQLEDDLGPGVSPNSLAAVKAGALAAAGLLHDARLTVLAALARDPDEATLHLLLGNLYLRTGLPQLAAESLDEAQFLARGER